MKKIISVCITLVLAAALSVCLALYLYKRSDDDSISSGIKYNYDHIEQWNDGETGKSGFDGIRIPGFGRLYFQSGTENVQMTLANPYNNECYFIYTINLDAPDGELLYTSSEVYPGTALRSITLSHPLQSGEYILYIYITSYDTVSGDQLNTALMKAPLTVSDS